MVAIIGLDTPRIILDDDGRNHAQRQNVTPCSLGVNGVLGVLLDDPAHITQLGHELADARHHVLPQVWAGPAKGTKQTHIYMISGLGQVLQNGTKQAYTNMISGPSQFLQNGTK